MLFADFFFAWFQIGKSVLANSTTVFPDFSNFSHINDQLVEKENNETLSFNLTTTAEETISELKTRCKTPSEVFSNCTNSCPASCEEKNRKPCKSYCWSGCECAPGYVKNFRWECIPIEECPICEKNENYRNCGPNCETTCLNYENLPIYCSTRANCKRGCFCSYGFVRDMEQNGTCVPKESCPKRCGPNEYWDMNGEPCLRSLENPRPNCLFEPPKPSCVCDTGFKRDPVTKQCVSFSPTAFQPECKLNETFSYCGSDCAKSCFDENKRELCPTVCHRGCFCKDGFWRDVSGRCVLKNDCRDWQAYHQNTIRYA